MLWTKMENPVDYLIKSVTSLFLDKSVDVENLNISTSLIRVHNERLKDKGDISLPINAAIWLKYLGDIGVNKELLQKLHNHETDTETTEKLVAVTSKWLHYPVKSLNIEKERCAVFLNRCVSIRTLLLQCLSGNGKESEGKPYGMLQNCLGPKMEVCQVVDSQNAANLSVYRASIIKNVLQRILAYCKWKEEKNSNETSAKTMQLHVFSVVEEAVNKTQMADDGNLMIRCGLVRDPTSGKLVQITTEEYLNLLLCETTENQVLHPLVKDIQSMRTADMRLMAMHKYGIRAKNDQRFCALMDRLGTAAVTVDLLEVKHSSPVQIIRNGQGSTKGASFILYNSARLETLLRRFEEHVSSASYAQLPPIDEISFELLCEEEEWQLCFGYILQFPNLIARCLEQIKQGRCATHLIVRYLSGFVAVFSVYYRRIRILTQETRTHLMPYVYARIYLIKATRSILNKALALLNIEPVLFM